MPGGSVSRETLEDLCLSLLEPTDRETMLEEIDAFLGHLQGGYQRSFPHLHKARLHTYFSITDRFVGMKIGEAAAAMAFDWKDPRLHFFPRLPSGGGSGRRAGGPPGWQRQGMIERRIGRLRMNGRWNQRPK